MCVNLLLFSKQTHLYPFIKFHIQAISYGICLSLSDLLHSVWQSLGTSMLLSTALFHSLLRLNNILLCLHTTSLCIHLPRDTGCFHVLAIVNSVAMNTEGHASIQIIVFFSDMPRGGIPGSYVDSSFLRNLQLFIFDVLFLRKFLEVLLHKTRVRIKEEKQRNRAGSSGTQTLQ